MKQPTQSRFAALAQRRSSEIAFNYRGLKIILSSEEHLAS